MQNPIYLHLSGHMAVLSRHFGSPDTTIVLGGVPVGWNVSRRRGLRALVGVAEYLTALVGRGAGIAVVRQAVSSHRVRTGPADHGRSVPPEPAAGRSGSGRCSMTPWRPSWRRPGCPGNGIAGGTSPMQCRFPSSLGLSLFRGVDQRYETVGDSLHVFWVGSAGWGQVALGRIYGAYAV